MVSPAPLVTVILPTFGRRKFLPAAIRSVRDQTFRDWRLLVVNDGGEDVSDVVASFGDPRIEWHDRPHLGKAAALNYGLGLVRSKYVSYMDDDDIVYPDHLAELVALAEREGAEFVYSDTWLVRVGPDGAEIRRDVENDRDVAFEDLRISNRINHKQILHTKRLADEVGPYDERLRILIDYSYVRRLAERSRPVHLRKITGEHFLRLASDDPNDFASISGLWVSDPEACGRSVAALFESDPAALATIYRDAVRLPGEVARHAATRDSLQRTRDSLQRTRDALQRTRDALRRTRDELDRFRASLRRTSDELGRVAAAQKRTQEVLERTQEAQRRTQEALEETRGTLKRTQETLQVVAGRLKVVQASLSYRVGRIATAPLRLFAEAFRRLRRRPS